MWFLVVVLRVLISARVRRLSASAVAHLASPLVPLLNTSPLPLPLPLSCSLSVVLFPALIVAYRKHLDKLIVLWLGNGLAWSVAAADMAVIRKRERERERGRVRCWRKRKRRVGVGDLFEAFIHPFNHLSIYRLVGRHLVLCFRFRFSFSFNVVFLLLIMFVVFLVVVVVCCCCCCCCCFCSIRL